MNGIKISSVGVDERAVVVFVTPHSSYGGQLHIWFLSESSLFRWHKIYSNEFIFRKTCRYAISNLHFKQYRFLFIVLIDIFSRFFRYTFYFNIAIFTKLNHFFLNRFINNSGNDKKIAFIGVSKRYIN